MCLSVNSQFIFFAFFPAGLLIHFLLIAENSYTGTFTFYLDMNFKLFNLLVVNLSFKKKVCMFLLFLIAILLTLSNIIISGF